LASDISQLICTQPIFRSFAQEGQKVMQQVAHTLEVVRSSVPVNCQQMHAQFVDPLIEGAD
jgi:hypothetical protein